MAPFSLFKRSKPGKDERVAEQTNAVAQDTPVPKRPVVTLGLDSNGRWRGIFRDERIHVAIVGFPGCGKSRYLLSLAIQDVWNGFGVLLIDPHGDLVKIFLSHIPKERWKDVIYIDPMTARNYGRVVKINFLECRDVKDRDVVARSFMESLEKVYARYWGPRLDMILMNAVYTLLDAENTNLSNLYNVIADEQFREAVLQMVGDEKIRNFWQSEFKRMPKDASSAALTKIYRIVQERIVAPVFDCIESSVHFRKAMDERKIIVVNLSEGAITSDVANFLGSLILARVYLAGMSREDTPEDQRVPFYVYVDEAYRFVSLSIRDMLQSLRKYRVYMTLASQYLGQYSKEIAASIPHLCDTIMCFTVGEDTAKTLEEFYKPSLNYLDLVHLPKFTIAVSTMVGGSRECQILRTVNLGWGQTNVEELVKFSLERYGEAVDVARYTGTPAVGDLPHPTKAGLDNPLYWVILVKLYSLFLENLGAGMASQGSVPSIEHNDLVEQLKADFDVSEVSILEALNGLAMRNYISIEEYPYDYEVLSIPVEAPAKPVPVECAKCKAPTCRPFTLKDGRKLCKFCVERVLRTGDVKPLDVVEPEIDPKLADSGRIKRIRETRKAYSITPIGRRHFPECMVPRGARGGGAEHAWVIGAIARILLKRYFYVVVDTGEETPRKVEDGRDEYVAKSLPDIVAWPVAKGQGGKLNPRFWDSAHAFTVEVERAPIKHRQRVVNNLRKNMQWGKPVVFATPRLKWAMELYDILKGELGEEVVEDNTGFEGGVYNPKAVSIIFIDPKTDTRHSVASKFIEAASMGTLPPTLKQRLELEEKTLPSEEEEEKPEGSVEAQAEKTAVEKPAVEKHEAFEEKPASGETKPPAKPVEGTVAGEARGEEVAEGAGIHEEAEKPAEEATAHGMSTELSFKSLEQLINVLAGDDWVFRRYVDEADMVYAEKKDMGEVLRVRIGTHGSLEKTFRLFNVRVETVTASKPAAPEVELQKPVEKIVEQPEAKPAEMCEEAEQGMSVRPEVSTETAVSVEAPKAELPETPERSKTAEPGGAVERIKQAGNPAEKMQIAVELHFSFKASKRGNKIYIYAQRRNRQTKKLETAYIGTWDEELRKTAEKLNLKLAFLSGTPNEQQSET